MASEALAPRYPYGCMPQPVALSISIRIGYRHGLRIATKCAEGYTGEYNRLPGINMTGDKWWQLLF